MIVQIKRIVILLFIICFPYQAAFSQSHVSRNNYTGAWETSASWSPPWSSPQTNNLTSNITINGYITVNGSLSFSIFPCNVIINDTLVINGNLTLGLLTNLTINGNGILIVRGNFTMGEFSSIITNNYIVVTGDFLKLISPNNGSFKSNNNPVKVFIGGNISPTGITNHKSNYPVLNCSTPATIPYPNSKCSYGNLTDIINDPIYPFFQSTCTIAIPTITAGGPITFCAGGSVTLTSSSGTSYLWSNGATSRSVNIAASGSYTVKVTNSGGCQSASSAATVVTVNAMPATPTITASGPTTFCSGGSVTLTSSPGTGYQWSNGASTSSIIVTASGNYTVRVTNGSGCQSSPSAAKIITVNSSPITPTITAGGPKTFCSGGSVTLTSSGGLNYLWSTGATTRAINVTSPGNYTVRITNSNGCQSAVSAAAVVNVNTLPAVNAGTDITIPNGTSTTITASVTGTGPFTYSWSPSSQLINASIKDPTTVNLATTTIFTLTATSITTTCSNTDAVKVNINGGPLNSTPTATPLIVCAGAPVQLHALGSGGSGSYTYTWTSIPAGFTSSLADPIANPTVSTTYHVAIFDGFTTINPQVAVAVNALPSTPVITAGGPTTFCAGGNVTLNSSAGTSYLWSTGETTQSIIVTSSGSYSVQVTNASGCQSPPSAAIGVTVNAIPATPTISSSGPTTFCDGDNITLTSSADASYLWSNSATSPSINITSAGSYTVQVTNANGCQSAVSTATLVTVNTSPVTPTITADGPTTFCTGGTVTLTSSPEINYLWSNGETLPSITVSATGSYSVKVTNEYGCLSSSSASVAIVVNASSGVTIDNNGPVCAGRALNLTSSPSGMIVYYWTGPDEFSSLLQNPSVTDSATLDMSGIYTLVVANANGCIDTVAQNVIVNAAPIAFAGPDQDLKFTFETQMNAELSAPEKGEWSLISGSGHISDIHSPTTSVNELSIGDNKFLWRVLNGNCEDTAEVKITVHDAFVPSVITPNGDGKNDYFKISEYSSKVELIIFNRWGNEEYSSGNYINDWDGRNNKGVELPNDTYFYILKFDNGRVLKGSVFIKR